MSSLYMYTTLHSGHEASPSRTKKPLHLSDEVQPPPALKSTRSLRKRKTLSKPGK